MAPGRLTTFSFYPTNQRTQTNPPTNCRLKTKKVKNESHTALGDKVGRIHLGRQDLSTMRVKRVKALRKLKDGAGEGEGGDEVFADDGSGSDGGGGDDGVYDSADEEEMGV